MRQTYRAAHVLVYDILNSKIKETLDPNHKKIVGLQTRLV